MGRIFLVECSSIVFEPEEVGIGYMADFFPG